MKYLKMLLLLIGVSMCVATTAQSLPVKMEELTAVQFKEAVRKSNQTAIIPIGVLEKHGAHMPLGTDVYWAREIALRAAEKEYAVVFPWYHFSQINEARHQPGTISYSPELVWRVLQETIDELHRNGFKKIILLNGHGGNKSFLDHFVYSQLAEKRDYAVYWWKASYDKEVVDKAYAITMVDKVNQHAGNRETSILKAIVPNLVDTSIANTQSGADLHRLDNLDRRLYTSIWWYARFPNHYAGDGSKANAEAGEILLGNLVSKFTTVIKEVKEDKNTLRLMKQFYKEAENPLNTKQ